MKFLKILLMFVVLVGIIVGVLVFATGGSVGSGNTGEDDPLFQSLKADIQRNWNATDNWNDTLYDRSLEMLSQSQSSLRDGYRTLVDFVDERACNRLDSLMMGEFAKADCREARIKELKRGLDRVLSNAPQLREDKRVKKMLGTYSLYVNLLTFARSSFRLPTGFRLTESAAAWNSFASHAQSVRAKKTNYMSSPYYTNVKNISDVARGLQSVDSRLQAARGNFSTQLANSIISAFRGQEPAESRSHLQQVYVQYTNEGFSNGNLNTFVSNY
ncbi:MAG: hypothetical protein IJ659_08790 [Alloprevotella sp.]|nr:hypothetical protein [Alloprevotella sp.]